jgi:hypothetical protein
MRGEKQAQILVHTGQPVLVTWELRYAIVMRRRSR